MTLGILKDNETIDTSFERVLYLFFFMFICAHYFGCLFYFCAFYVAKTYPKAQTWPEIDGLWKVQNLYHVVGDASNATTINVVQNVTTDCAGGYIMTDYSMRLQDEENRFVLCFWQI